MAIPLLRTSLIALSILLSTAALALESTTTKAPQEDESLFDTPFEVPFDPAFDVSPLPDFRDIAPSTRPAAPADQAADAALAAPTPVDTGPDYSPPAIDAYVDVSLNSNDLGNFGFNETTGSYRLIIGFRLKDVGDKTWSLAPEFGYFRAGKAAQDVINIDNNSTTLPGYIITQTDTYSMDTTSLDFGLRFSRILRPHLHGHVRAGVGFYHLTQQQKTNRSYTRKVGTTEERPDDTLPTITTIDTGIAPFISLGMGVDLSTRFHAYAEYGTRIINSNLLNTGAIGLLFDF